jgi:hypothetical protein
LNALSDEKKKLFHSIAAKLLYYAKRIRPDLLVAVVSNYESSEPN